ncbi:MAG: hypothetical protein JW987_03075 [Anaerolineaceae bacterium]|nr:hypothetical protein [Anaerolineaceae bacterium]
MKKYFLLILCIFLLASCIPQPASTLEPTPTAPLEATLAPTPAPTLMGPTLPPTPPPVAALSLETLRNGVYNSVDWGEFQLTDGIYYRTPPTSQESSEAYTTRMLDALFYGDLNGDGAEDAVVFLATQNGGTGHFVEMAAVLNVDGAARNVSSRSLGDRVVVEGGSIDGGLLTLLMRVHGPEDGLCCPSQSATWSFRLQDGQWVQVE